MTDLENPSVQLISELPEWLILVNEKGSDRQTYLWLRDFEDDRERQNANLHNIIMATSNSGIARMVGFVKEADELYLKVKAPQQPQVSVCITKVAPDGLIQQLTLKGEQSENWFLRHT